MHLLRILPYWRLSGFYFFYFASLGILIPYFAPYLVLKGFSPAQIGELIAILLATRIIAPSVGGFIADHYGKRMQTVRLAGLASIVAFAAILSATSYVSFALIILLFSFFWHISLPQFEATTLQHLGDHHHHYSKIRIWGSLGFILTVILVGSLLEYTDAHIVPIIMLISMGGIWLTSLAVPESSPQYLTHHQHAHPSIMALLKRRDVIAFLMISFLSQFSHGPYYTFYSIHLENNDYSATLIGWLWALGVIAEMGVFLIMHRLLKAVRLHHILLVSLLLTSLRWLAIGFFPQSLAIMIGAQCLHAASFGTFHAAAIAWLHQHFTGKHHGQGQGLYSGLGFGAGGALGSLLSGYLWSTYGATATFNMAAIASLAAFFIGLRWLK